MGRCYDLLYPKRSAYQATEPPVLPPLPPSSTPRSVVVADPVEVTNVIPGDSICSSKPPLPVTASGLVFTEGDDPGLVPFSTNPEKPTCRAASLSTDEGRDTNTMECTSLVADDKDNVEAEGVYDSQNSGSTGSHAKSPVTVTSIEAYVSSSLGSIPVNLLSTIQAHPVPQRRAQIR